MDLTDLQWTIIEPLFEEKRRPDGRGRPWRDAIRDADSSAKPMRLMERAANPSAPPGARSKAPPTMSSTMPSARRVESGSSPQPIGSERATHDLDTSDIHVEVVDLLGNHVEAEIGVAFFVAVYSALRRVAVSPALLVLGDMSVQGNIKPMRSLTEPLQVANDNGARRALIPIENKRNFLDVPGDIVEHVDPIFYGDPKTAAMKVLGLV